MMDNENELYLEVGGNPNALDMFLENLDDWEFKSYLRECLRIEHGMDYD